MDYKARQLERNGVSLNYIDEGHGPAVMLVHGFPDSINLWRHQIPALLDTGYRVIAADNRGMGQSDAPMGSEAYALDEIVSDLVAILDAGAVERVAVVGHDWARSSPGDWSIASASGPVASCPCPWALPSVTPAATIYARRRSAGTP